MADSVPNNIELPPKSHVPTESQPETISRGAPTAKSRRVAFAMILGFVLALVAMGLPMIGIAVNLYLGSLILTLAFALLAYGLWTWETIADWKKPSKICTIVIFGLMYFSLIGLQITAQYKKDHPLIKPVVMGYTVPKSNTTPPAPNVESAVRNPHLNPPKQSKLSKLSVKNVANTGSLSQSAAQTAAPTESISAPNGIAIGGNAQVENPTVNNYGEQMPKILGFQIVPLDSLGPEVDKPQPSTHPLTAFKFYIDTSWTDPKFFAVCDRPCRAVYLSALTRQEVTIQPSFRAATADTNPNVAIFVPNQKPFPSDSYFLFTVESADSQPVKVTAVGTMKGSIKPSPQ